MWLPGLSLAFAAALSVAAAGPAREARAANEPVAVTVCMDLAEPRTFSDEADAKPVEAVLPTAARPVPTPLDARALVDQKSYGDVFKILSTDNPCSRFFGGPAKAVETFNRFASKLDTSPLGDPQVAIRMSGGFSYYQDHKTGASYRLFDRAAINSDGPLGTRAVTGGRAARVQVGSFQGHTPQARALIMLHELGHLVRTPEGGWLLPNDGHNPALSTRNTREVEARCAEQLRAVRD